MDELIMTPSRKKFHTQKGFSTLEMLIAMTLIVLALSAVTLVSFGNQTMAATGQAGAEALSLAQRALENAQAQARKDFALVNSAASSTAVIGGMSYAVSMGVISSADHLAKKVTSRVSWKADDQRVRSVELSALVTNFDNAIGGDTCDSTPSGDWTRPRVMNPLRTDFSTLVGGGAYAISGMDIASSTLYVAVASTTNAADPTFFIFDVADPANPVLLGSLDNATSTKNGLNAVRVAKDPASGKTYAYVAVAHGANFSSCSPRNSCAQLQVIDVTDPFSLSPASVIKSLKVSSYGSGGQGIGKSLAYRNGYIYMGLVTGGGGKEFHVIDVHNPLVPAAAGGIAVGGTVNAVTVKKDRAYLATTNASRELIIVDVSNPAPFTLLDSYNPPDVLNNGKSVAVVGDRAYLGRTKTIGSGNRELYVLDVSSSTDAVATGTAKVAGSSANAVIVRDDLAFLATTAGEIQIWNIADAASVAPLANFTIPAGGSAHVLECEGNTLYVATNDGSGNGYLSIIGPS